MINCVVIFANSFSAKFILKVSWLINYRCIMLFQIFQYTMLFISVILIFRFMIMNYLYFGSKWTFVLFNTYFINNTLLIWAPKLLDDCLFRQVLHGISFFQLDVVFPWKLCKTWKYFNHDIFSSFKARVNLGIHHKRFRYHHHI